MNKRFYLQISLLLLLGLGWLSYNLLSPIDYRLKVWQCPFKAITGIACPGCGTTRGFNALIMHHDVREAILQYNAFSVIELLLMVLVIVILVIDGVTRGHRLYNLCMNVEAMLKRKWLLYPIVLLIIANWAWNIAKGI